VLNSIDFKVNISLKMWNLSLIQGLQAHCRKCAVSRYITAILSCDSADKLLLLLLLYTIKEQFSVSYIIEEASISYS
jgi:hypothetical protein